jgi:hypothetical protein
VGVAKSRRLRYALREIHDWRTLYEHRRHVSDQYHQSCAPILNHFPIALLVVSWVLDQAARWVPKVLATTS